MGTAAKRELIRAALLENPELTHRAIAKRLKVSPVTVGTACAELMSKLDISECRHRLTEDGKQAPGPKPAPRPEVSKEELLARSAQIVREHDEEPVATPSACLLRCWQCHWQQQQPGAGRCEQCGALLDQAAEPVQVSCDQASGGSVTTHDS